MVTQTNCKPAEMDVLRMMWKEIISRYTDREEPVGELWTEITECYTAKGRHYHNLAHLHYMATMAMEYKDRLDDFDTLMFSIFYHDIVYNPVHSDNEVKSADIASDRLAKLGVPSDKIIKCRQQILATKDHVGQGENDTDHLLDFDLAILGDTPVKYKEYAEKIRKEYWFYPNFLYKKGRKKVLQHFLGTMEIYKTHECHKNLEQRARENLKAELLELGGHL